MGSCIILRDLKDSDHHQRVDQVFTGDDVEQLRNQLVILSNIFEIRFVTGNENKVKELANNLDLKHINLIRTNIDLIEMQGHELDILQDKCERAYKTMINTLGGQQQLAVLIDDTSLNFGALNGMPGPYVKCKFRTAY